MQGPAGIIEFLHFLTTGIFHVGRLRAELIEQIEWQGAGAFLQQGA